MTLQTTILTIIFAYNAQRGAHEKQLTNSRFSANVQSERVAFVTAPCPVGGSRLEMHTSAAIYDVVQPNTALFNVQQYLK